MVFSLSSEDELHSNNEHLEKYENSNSEEGNTQRKKMKRISEASHEDDQMNRANAFTTNKKNPKKVLEWKLWEIFLRPLKFENYELECVTNKSNGPSKKRDPPSDLLMTLLPFQKEWLAWCLKQESSEIKGGILADEMGMGKTIQAISLVLTSRSLFRSTTFPSSNLHTDNVRKSPSFTSIKTFSGVDILSVKATLVICPLVALIQWLKEITRFTEEGSVRVMVYHGPKRCRDAAKFSEFDFVLTSYAIVESDYRGQFLPSKETCKMCGKRLISEKMDAHLRDFCPSSLSVGKEEHSKQIKETLDAVDKSDKTLYLTRGSNPSTSLNGEESLEDKKVVYAVDSNDNVAERWGGKKKKKSEVALQKANKSLEKPSSKRLSVLHAVKWERVILDEAHYIKDSRSNTAKAVFALKSNYRWALSGTPLQNHVGEFFSLVRFLAIEPFSYYYCKKCDCKSLNHSITQKCLHCKHWSLEHFWWWNKTILRCDAFDPREEDFYQTIYTDSQSKFNTYVEAGTLSNNYIHVFSLLTRLRKAVNHPYLVVYTAQGSSQPTGEQSHNVENPVKSITIELKYSSILNRINLQKFQSSTKIDALVLPHQMEIEELALMLEIDPSAKGIVFSQFVSFLDIIGFCLEKFAGIKYVKLIGGAGMEARDRMIDQFKNDHDCKVFLISLKAGGVALNLTVASHVFLMDPWWNPAVEQQAQDRIHRLGQYKPVRMVRFIIENTIEERILKLQEKKQLIFEGFVDGSARALERLSEDDLKFLFTR